MTPNDPLDNAAALGRSQAAISVSLSLGEVHSLVQAWAGDHEASDSVEAQDAIDALRQQAEIVLGAIKYREALHHRG